MNRKMKGFHFLMLSAGITGALLMLIFLIIISTVVSHNRNINRDEVMEMNEQELHYDADGYFIMVDTKTGLLGIYDATEPIRHLWVGDQLPNGIIKGVYLSHYTQNGLFFTAQSSDQIENDPFVLTLENSIEVPEGTPVLVY